ncbi:MAG: outer membrane protein assembly factor BamD [Candidatus Zophobacter franzmannii]|nr:outer membrane protein assembly factor BamD [Candidatus Zophobacter franzmannii]
MKRLIYVISLLLLLVGCSRNNTILTVNEKMQKADQLFSAKKFKKAAILYQDVVFERSSALTAVAQMKLADCYFKDKDFLDARLEYEQMIKLFPDNEKIADAYYRIGVCDFEDSLPAPYTQEETESAIRAFGIFLDKFPQDTRRTGAIEYIQKCQYKLLEKTYENGRIYFKIVDYSGSLMYLEEIMDLGNTDKLDSNSHLMAGRIYLHWENYPVAKAHLADVIQRYPDTKEAKKAKKYLKKIREIEEKF